MRSTLKDEHFERRELAVRAGKGGSDRRTMLPAAIREDLRLQIEKVEALHDRDVANGHGCVDLPGAIARKYPNSGFELAW